MWLLRPVSSVDSFRFFSYQDLIRLFSTVSMLLPVVFLPVCPYLYCPCALAVVYCISAIHILSSAALKKRQCLVQKTHTAIACTAYRVRPPCVLACAVMHSDVLAHTSTGALRSQREVGIRIIHLIWTPPLRYFSPLHKSKVKFLMKHSWVVERGRGARFYSKRRHWS